MKFTTARIGALLLVAFGLTTSAILVTPDEWLKLDTIFNTFQYNFAYAATLLTRFVGAPFIAVVLGVFILVKTKSNSDALLVAIGSAVILVLTAANMFVLQAIKGGTILGELFGYPEEFFSIWVLMRIALLFPVVSLVLVSIESFTKKPVATQSA
jgi:hypothetical protein